MNPPNPYENEPQVGSTTEANMGQGTRALLTTLYLLEREGWEWWAKQEKSND